MKIENKYNFNTNQTCPMLFFEGKTTTMEEDATELHQRHL